MTSRRAWLLALAAAPVAAALADQTAAVPPEVASELPGARLQGSARLRFVGLRIYDARLWSGERTVAGDEWVRAPLALELRYLRSLDGPKIAERSLDEMRLQGEIAGDVAARWLARMTQLFPDVKAGDRITGVLLPPATTRFFVNARAVGEVQDAAFAKRFFGIWLAPQTSQPALRQQLLGGGRP